MIFTIQSMVFPNPSASSENERFILWLCELARHNHAEFDRAAIDRMLLASGSSAAERSYLLGCLFGEGHQRLPAHISRSAHGSWAPVFADVSSLGTTRRGCAPRGISNSRAM
jgi:hypothetical protein